MSAPILLPINPYTLPNGYCFTSAQDVINQAGKSTVSLENSGFTVLLGGATAPGATDRDKFWMNSDDDRIYRWENSVSAWVSRHPWPPGGAARIWWTDTLANLALFDGGDAGVVGDASGGMFVEDTTMAGRFPLHVGTLSPSGTILVLNATGGVDTVTLSAAESGLPSHKHTFPWLDNTSGSGSDNKTGTANSTFTGGLTKDASTEGGTAASSAHTNMPPYKTGYWAKRSARKFYVGT